MNAPNGGGFPWTGNAPGGGCEAMPESFLAGLQDEIGGLSFGGYIETRRCHVATMISEVYDALRSVGIAEGKALGG
jgi:hypothetical protein